MQPCLLFASFANAGNVLYIKQEELLVNATVMGKGIIGRQFQLARQESDIKCSCSWTREDWTQRHMWGSDPWVSTQDLLIPGVLCIQMPCSIVYSENRCSYKHLQEPYEDSRQYSKTAGARPGFVTLLSEILSLVFSHSYSSLNTNKKLSRQKNRTKKKEECGSIETFVLFCARYGIYINKKI